MAYEPPEQVHDKAPRVIFWYRAYAALMLLGSLASLGLATLLAWTQTLPEIAMQSRAAESQMLAIVFFLVAAASAVLYGVAAFMPLKPWAWTFGIIVLGLGCPGVLIVVCLPMLLAWFKPNVKAAFCRV